VRTFEEYIKNGVIRKVSRDLERAKGLFHESARKFNSLQERTEKIGIRDENANDYVELCYDLLMLLIRAKLYSEGYSSSGQGAHEAEVAYMVILGFTDQDTRFMDQLRYFRNGILYYGTALDQEYADKVIRYAKRIYPKLREIAEDATRGTIR
jgi:hypothetical protein